MKNWPTGACWLGAIGPGVNVVGQVVCASLMHAAPPSSTPIARMCARFAAGSRPPESTPEVPGNSASGLGWLARYCSKTETAVVSSPLSFRTVSLTGCPPIPPWAFQYLTDPSIAAWSTTPIALAGPFAAAAAPDELADELVAPPLDVVAPPPDADVDELEFELLEPHAASASAETTTSNASNPARIRAPFIIRPLPLVLTCDPSLCVLACTSGQTRATPYMP